MTRIEDLTPDERERVQLVFLERWLALKSPRGTRRRTDSPVPVQRFDATGTRVA